MTFDGSNFPAGLGTADVVEITGSDGSKCKLDSISSTQLRCIKDDFTGLQEIEEPYTLPLQFAVIINGETTPALPVSRLRADIVKILAIEPKSASPVAQ